MSVDACIDEIDTSRYFENARSPFPFVVAVETNGLYRGGYALEGSPGQTRVHFWFFGYLSDAF